MQLNWTATQRILYLQSINGGLAQLARALAWHARGHRFESDILHIMLTQAFVWVFLFPLCSVGYGVPYGKVIGLSLLFST